MTTILALVGFAALLWIHARRPSTSVSVPRPEIQHRPRRRAPGPPRKRTIVPAVRRDLESALRNLGYRSADLKARISAGELASSSDFETALRAALR
jgi:hypothetical protein